MFLAPQYESTDGASSHLASVLASALVKVLVKVFKRLHLLNIRMEVVRTEVLCSTIPTHRNDLEFKFKDLEKNKKIILKFLIKAFRGEMRFR